MSPEFDVHALKVYLEDACDRLARRQPVEPFRDFCRRRWAWSAAVGLSLTLTGCGGEVGGDRAAADPDCAQPDCIEQCDDGVDNDGDGDIDCEDQDCWGSDLCPGQRTAIYAAPLETGADCSDGADNDGDGLIDCDDEDCSQLDYCLGSPAYGEPFEANCGDGIDNDDDGGVDCADQDCVTSGYCVVLYGAMLVEECDNGLDDDYDGLIDCEDEDCAQLDYCIGSPIYGEPVETNCDDGIDNDDDGATDCSDEDCALATACGVDAYGIMLWEDCSNGIDDDNDGATDCEDSECAGAAVCQGGRYGVPIEPTCTDGQVNPGETDVRRLPRRLGVLGELGLPESSLCRRDLSGSDLHRWGAERRRGGRGLWGTLPRLRRRPALRHAVLRTPVLREADWTRRPRRVAQSVPSATLRAS